MAKKNLLPRVLLLALFIFPLFYLGDVYLHFYTYLTGNIITRLISGQWQIVVINILLFAAFLIPLSFRRKAKWSEYGLVGAFFVSLFIEMYGIPLTILFAAKYFYSPSAALPPNVIEFNLLNVGFGMDLAMAYGAILIILGSTLIMLGWVTLFRNIKKSGLVTQGIYSYSRHPQYLGFILIVCGWFIGWPTILSFIFVPILLYKYIRVSLTEEKEVAAEFAEYQAYKKSVPFFV